MGISKLVYCSVFMLVLVLWPKSTRGNANQALPKDGELVVNLTWGDIENTPADDVYVEAYGFVEKYDSSRSFVLKMSHAGQIRNLASSWQL